MGLQVSPGTQVAGPDAAATCQQTAIVIRRSSTALLWPKKPSRSLGSWCCHHLTARRPVAAVTTFALKFLWRARATMPRRDSTTPTWRCNATTPTRPCDATTPTRVLQRYDTDVALRRYNTNAALRRYNCDATTPTRNAPTHDCDSAPRRYDTNAAPQRHDYDTNAVPQRHDYDTVPRHGTATP
ncbi:hypothetical protein EDB85DRAFT_2141133 [Lactarius pseudohatsudake]|nr:hypothetical protein EDB85DRAFT_2141133 [Lactarius pseudohatsudake]